MKLFTPHIQYTLEEVQKCSAVKDMPVAIEADTALSMIEASRFPGLEWKRFAIKQAEQVTSQLHDSYVQSRLAEKKCLLYRLTGNMEQASRAVDSAGLGQVPEQRDSRTIRVASGYIAIQRALNHIQLEQLALATDALNAWEPTLQSPSTMEDTVIFRKYIMLGKILRYQGRSKDSLTHLELAKGLADRHRDLTFIEDRGDLAWSLADTFQELDVLTRGEHYIQTEMERLGPDFAPSLKIALAESLFAQGRFTDSDRLCTEARSLSRLLKLERLRLYILQAKLSHVGGRYGEAFDYWTEAMTAVSKFTLTNGHTTRIILLSICDPPLVELMQQGQDVERRSREQLNTLEQLAAPSGIKHWIPGLRQWEGYLTSARRSRHSRM